MPPSSVEAAATHSGSSRPISGSSALAGGMVGSDGGGGCATEQSLPEPPSGVEPADRQSELHPGKTHEMPAIDEEGGALEQPQKQKLQQQDSTARFSPLRPLSALGSLQIRDSDGGDGQQFEGGGGGIDNASSSPRSGVAVSTRHHQPQHDWVLQGSSPAAVAGLNRVWSPGPAGRRGSSQAESVLGPWGTRSERRSSGVENIPVGR